MLVGGDADRARRLVPEITERVHAGDDALVEGPTVRRRCSPASVGATLRVVRLEQPDADPRLELADRVAQRRCETPSLAAARVKLRSWAIARKALRSPRSSRPIIDAIYSPMRIGLSNPKDGRCLAFKGPTREAYRQRCRRAPSDPPPRPARKFDPMKLLSASLLSLSLGTAAMAQETKPATPSSPVPPPLRLLRFRRCRPLWPDMRRRTSAVS